MKLWICMLVLVSSSALAQLPSTPPTKMGLWEAEVSTRISGGGSADAPAEKTVQRSCVSPETWKSFAMSNEQAKGCKLARESYAGRTYSVDTVCPASAGNSGSSTMHLEIVFYTQETMHFSMAMKMDMGDGKPINIASTASAKYLAADCGDISPGDSKTLGK